MSMTQHGQNGATAPPHSVRLWTTQLQLTLGLGLAAVAGMWAGRAWSEGTILSWAIGVVSLTCGVMAAIMGTRRSAPPTGPKQYRAPEPRPASLPRTKQPLPLLGELLAHRYHLITAKQLQDALEEQRHRGGPLGQILVAMRLVEYEQLAEVLEDQLTYGDPWRGFAGRLRADTATPSVPTETK